MRAYHIAFFALFALLTSGAAARDAWEFSYELRAPKTATFDPATRFELVTNEGYTSSPLHLVRRRDEADVVVFSELWLIFSGQRNRAVRIVRRDRPDQVFLLTIPTRPKPADWSAWRKPDYTEKTHGGWAPVKDEDRSTELPPESFELRFKVTKHEKA